MRQDTLEGRAKTKNGVIRLCFSVLCILLEAAFIIIVITRLNEYAEIVNLLTRVFAGILVLALYASDQTSSMKMPWIILILVFPIMGVALYLLIGLNGGTRKMRERYADIDRKLLPLLPDNREKLENIKNKIPKAGNISEYIWKNAGYPVYQNTDIVYYDEAVKGLEAQLSALSKAEKFIFMEYHAIEDAEAWKKIQKVLEERVQAYEKKQGCQDTEGQDKLRTEEVLHDVSLTLRRGEKLAIVGYNGAGKTTLIKLVMRLYDPTSGRILYNGQDIREFDLADYRAHIGAVFQDYCLFAATVAENVMGGRYDASPESEAAVRKALDSASFTERLATLEKGLDTPLTRELDENGVNLSGGEAQKIAIARVFVRPYELIIMDEPSSALDPVAEYELNHSILNAADRQDRTVIFISHRLSTTRFADRILLFADGCLRESGSHDRLMELNGLYAEMFRMQAEKYRRGEEQETA